jgi:hypothetical protein
MGRFEAIQPTVLHQQKKEEKEEKEEKEYIHEKHIKIKNK